MVRLLFGVPALVGGCGVALDDQSAIFTREWASEFVSVTVAFDEGQETLDLRVVGELDRVPDPRLVVSDTLRAYTSGPAQDITLEFLDGEGYLSATSPQRSDWFADCTGDPCIVTQLLRVNRGNPNTDEVTVVVDAYLRVNSLLPNSPPDATLSLAVEPL